MNNLQISIPQPCTADWDKMTPSEKGRHCKECSKEVYDFTQIESNHLQKLFTKFKANRTDVCGSFSHEQLFQAKIKDHVLSLKPDSLNLKQKFIVAIVFAFILGGFSSCTVVKRHSGEPQFDIDYSRSHSFLLEKACEPIYIRNDPNHRNLGEAIWVERPSPETKTTSSLIQNPDEPSSDENAQTENHRLARISNETFNHKTILPFDKPFNAASFAFNETSLNDSSRIALDQLAIKLKELEFSSIEVIGHTDSTGHFKANKNVSERRATAVAEYLTEKGLKVSEVRGVGYSYPLRNNASHNGRAANRRVELILRK